MNVIEATIALYLFYQDNDCFEIDEDYEKLLIITDKGDIKAQAAVRCALGDLIEMGVVKKQEARNHNNIPKDYYVLVRNLSNAEQTIKLPGELCGRIAGCVNEFCDVIGDNADKCSPYSITAQDIHNVLLILEFVKSRLNAANETSDDSTTDTL